MEASSAPAASPVDVLISGAGAAGMTLAIELARRGNSFRLIDKIATPFPGSRGKAIQPRTLEVFEDLGLVDRIAARGGPYPPQRETHADGTVTEAAVMEHGGATPAEPYPAPVMIAQFVTEGIMRERLAELGHAVEFGHELLGFAQDAAGITARVAGPGGEETVRARFLVGADGGRSFVRHALAVDFPGKTLDARAIVADLTMTGVTRDAWHRFGKGPGAISLCPLMGTDMIQLQGPIAADAAVDLSARGLQALIAERTGRDDFIVHAVSWASVFSPHARLADTYRVGRAFLAGDAAHAHPPTGGQGLNTSIQDAYNLGWKLAAVLAGAPDALLDSYAAERRPVAADMLGMSTRLLDAMKAGELKRGREVQQLDLGYPGSPLALTRVAGNPRVAAGFRAPDAPMLGAGGQNVRLFELFKGPHWTLLGYETRTAGVGPRAGLHIHHIGAAAELRDAGGHFGDAYGLATDDRVLVRPDGYIGAIVGGDEVAALAEYMRNVGL